ncbi:MAG: hypothetical protein IKM33_05370 [Clostridia bacterium]|nr:hypothetical protein [Clostridia bacterium]
MNQTENTEALVAEAEFIPEEAVMEEAVSEEDASPDTAAADDELVAEAEGVRAVYPHFDLTAELSHPVLGAILRGEAKPTLRQLYEAVHLEDILESRVAAGVQEQVAHAVTSAVTETVASAVTEAVATAVRETEERILSNIHARGQRPSEVGMAGGGGIRMHPAVNRLTRKERAMLARRAENGETIQF